MGSFGILHLAFFFGKMVALNIQDDTMKQNQYLLISLDANHLFSLRFQACMSFPGEQETILFAPLKEFKNVCLRIKTTNALEV